MLIGNRWVENAYLKILNLLYTSTANWVVVPGVLTTGLAEKGIVKGLSTAGGSNARSVVAIKILVDGSPIHQGSFRAYHDPTVWFPGNQQPIAMHMPELDIPPDSCVELMVRTDSGAHVELNYDFFMLTYEVKSWEQAVQPVCYLEDDVGRQRESG
jgi:hypothetical protein